MPKSPSTKPTKVLRFVCKEKLYNRATKKKTVCNKVIESMYPSQFDFWVAEHKAKHAKRRASQAPEAPRLSQSSRLSLVSATA